LFGGRQTPGLKKKERKSPFTKALRGTGASVTELCRHQTRGEKPLWAIPAVIVLGGGAYWIAHIH
jgi:hypothetical protein